MLDWLVEYGVSRCSFNPEDLDILDKMELQDQINATRRKCAECLKIMDDIQAQIVECATRSNKLSSKINEQAATDGVRANSLFAVNDEWNMLDAKQKALSAGLYMVQQQLDFYRSDLRILNNVFYQKF